MSKDMNDEQLQRYARHIMLDGIGIEGQTRLLEASALVIGAGGLGSAAAPYLAAAGVGRITLVDDDTIELSNLQRQIMHATAGLGRAKVESGRDMLHALNPEIEITALRARADAALLDELVPAASVVLDCCDNFVTRQAVNRACVRHRVPLVSGAAIRYDGQLGVFDPRREDSPCYACLFPPDAGVVDAACATLGVFAPAVAMIGAAQASEAIKLIAAGESTLTGKLMMLDARTLQWTTVGLAREPGCPVCGH
ncbi:MAG: molybdopterin-synthase adenylyltransferase MoeB [Candidatus Protistobacter heckmanni]|nr:molybdopterin-synthase adenylyltransferase MoeB [Candidatus Protistobacter heckmanni]